MCLWQSNTKDKQSILSQKRPLKHKRMCYKRKHFHVNCYWSEALQIGFNMWKVAKTWVSQKHYSVGLDWHWFWQILGYLMWLVSIRWRLKVRDIFEESHKAHSLPWAEPLTPWLLATAEDKTCVNGFCNDFPVRPADMLRKMASWMK